MRLESKPPLLSGGDKIEVCPIGMQWTKNRTLIPLLAEGA